MDTLTTNEKIILDLIRNLRPFEAVTIGADKTGKPNNFTVGYTRKGIINDDGIIYITI